MKDVLDTANGGPLTDLGDILRTIAPRLEPDRYVFTSVRHNAPVPLTATCMMREPEGISLVMHERDANALGLITTFPCRLITLTVNSSLYAVGLLAELTRALAEAGISVSPVSAFHHDHLFVPLDRADEALAILETLSSNASSRRLE